MIGIILFSALSCFFSLVAFFYLREQKRKHQINSYYANLSSQLQDVELITYPINQLKISSPNLCRQIYSKPTTLPENLGLGDLFGRWLGSCMGNLEVNSPAWCELKKIFRPLFENKYGVIVEINQLISEWITNLAKLQKQSRITCSPVSIEEVIDDLPLKFILHLIFGRTFVETTHSRKFKILQKSAQHLMKNIFHNQSARYRYYRLFRSTETNKTLRKFQKLWNYILDQAKTVQNEGCYYQLYQNYLNNQSGHLTFQMFSQTLAEIIYANQDVAIPSLSWLVVHYSMYPELYNNDDPHSFIEESARLEPVFPTSMPKNTTSDIILNHGVVIKKNTTVCIDFMGIGKCQNEWGMTDLDQFRPNRFTEQQIISRFGYGGRKCPGRKLADRLFVSVLRLLFNQGWVLQPLNPLLATENNIRTDQTKPFRMPQMNFWICNRMRTKDEISLYFDCPPFAEELSPGFVGISVNQRSPYLQSEYCDALVKYLVSRGSPNKYLIMIADLIANYNIQAFSRYKPDRAVKEALKMGDQMSNFFTQSILRYGQDQVELCRWNDLNIPDLSDDLSKFDHLSQRVAVIADKFLNKRGRNLVRSSYDSKLELVKKYIYSELPALVCGICYNKTWYRLLYYSGSIDHLRMMFTQNDQSLNRLVMDITTQSEFSEVRSFIMDKMNTNQVKISGFIGIDIDKII